MLCPSLVFRARRRVPGGLFGLSARTSEVSRPLPPRSAKMVASPVGSLSRGSSAGRIERESLVEQGALGARSPRPGPAAVEITTLKPQAALGLKHTLSVTAVSGTLYCLSSMSMVSG